MISEDQNMSEYQWSACESVYINTCGFWVLSIKLFIIAQIWC